MTLARNVGFRKILPLKEVKAFSTLNSLYRSFLTFLTFFCFFSKNLLKNPKKSCGLCIM